MQSISAARVETLVGDFDRSPAYVGLAISLTHLIGDGRIGLGTRLPSERELTEALGVSRTTVTRAYAALRDAGYAEARQGAGTFTRVPGGQSRAHDRALLPRPGDHDAIDLNCAAASAPPGIANAYAEAGAELPAYLGGHGYFPAGLPQLQAAIAETYEERGLPTDPGQILVTPGALSAASIVAQAFTGPGDRVLVESPVYPNATLAIRHSGARLTGSPVDPDGWDLDAVGATLRQVSARARLPDPRLPEPHRPPDDRRPARGVRRPPPPHAHRRPSSTRRTSSWRSTGRRCRVRSRRSRRRRSPSARRASRSGAGYGSAGSALPTTRSSGSPTPGSASISEHR